MTANEGGAPEGSNRLVGGGERRRELRGQRGRAREPIVQLSPSPSPSPGAPSPARVSEPGGRRGHPRGRRALRCTLEGRESRRSEIPRAQVLCWREEEGRSR